MSRIVLASASPRRKELLSWLGLRFDVRESGFDESVVEFDEPEELVEVLAGEKARKVMQQIRSELGNTGGVVVGADTVVAIEEGGCIKVLGKPKDNNEAREMLELLRGKVHVVWTGVAVMNMDTEELRVESVSSEVEFRNFSDKELDEYLASGEAMGKAGAYAIQGLAGKFVSSVSGSYTNVVGLPLKTLAGMLEEMGVRVGKNVEAEIYGRTGYRD